MNDFRFELIDTTKYNSSLLEVTKVAGKDGKIFGNTSMYTWLGDTVWVLKKQNEIVGFIQYRILKRKPIVSLHRIGVKSEYRRLGLGSKLFQKMLDHCRQSKVEKVRLKCPKDCSANLFYKQLGFTLVETTKSRAGRDLNVWEKEI